MGGSKSTRGVGLSLGGVGRERTTADRTDGGMGANRVKPRRCQPTEFRDAPTCDAAPTLASTPLAGDLWVETSLAHVVVALLDDDGRLDEWEA